MSPRLHSPRNWRPSLSTLPTKPSQFLILPTPPSLLAAINTLEYSITAITSKNLQPGTSTHEHFTPYRFGNPPRSSLPPSHHPISRVSDKIDVGILPTLPERGRAYDKFLQCSARSRTRGVLSRTRAVFLARPLCRIRGLWDCVQTLGVEDTVGVLRRGLSLYSCFRGVGEGVNLMIGCGGYW